MVSFIIFMGFLIYSFKYEKEGDLFRKPAISKKEAVRLAEKFINPFGLRAKNYPRRILEYNSRNQDALYLVKKYGDKQARSLIDKEKIPYAYWSINWGGVREESVSVDIDTQDGRVIGYEYSYYPSLEEKINNLKEAEAKKVAEDFLLSEKIDLWGKFELVNINKNTRNIQEEYYFKWAKKDLKLGEAGYIVNLAIKADKIAGFSQSLQLPKDYKYEYENNLFLSKFWAMLSSGISLLLGIILVVLAIIKRKVLNWRLARLWAIVLGPVFLINFLNEQSTYPFYIDTIYKFIGALFYSFNMFLLIPVTEQLFKENFKKNIFIKLNKRNNIFSSLIVCYALTFFSLVLVSITYHLLNHFKIAWNVGVGHVSNAIFTSRVIYLSPLMIGIIPAFTEEFFRGFSMAFCKKIFRSTAISIVIAAFLWGFGHTVIDGSFYPGYIVGLEKFISGIIVGYILLYFGIETAILWHFLNNFFATDIFLSYLGSNFMIYAACLSFIVILPFFISLYLYFKKPSISLGQA
jgi:hypothetical protein